MGAALYSARPGTAPRHRIRHPARFYGTADPPHCRTRRLRRARRSGGGRRGVDGAVLACPRLVHTPGRKDQAGTRPASGKADARPVAEAADARARCRGAAKHPAIGPPPLRRSHGVASRRRRAASAAGGSSSPACGDPSGEKRLPSHRHRLLRVARERADPGCRGACGGVCAGPAGAVARREKRLRARRPTSPTNASPTP